MLGRARRVDDAEQKWSALRAISDQLAPGSWDYSRQPSKRELAATTVLAVELAEASVKVRTGPPSDDPADLDSSRWAGVLPVRTVVGIPEPAADVDTDVAVPPHLLHRALR